jgi:hypothetical protein
MIEVCPPTLLKVNIIVNKVNCSGTSSADANSYVHRSTATPNAAAAII